MTSLSTRSEDRGHQTGPLNGPPPPPNSPAPAPRHLLLPQLRRVLPVVLWALPPGRHQGGDVSELMRQPLRDPDATPPHPSQRVGRTASCLPSSLYSTANGQGSSGTSQGFCGHRPGSAGVSVSRLPLLFCKGTRFLCGPCLSPLLLARAPGLPACLSVTSTRPCPLPPVPAFAGCFCVPRPQLPPYLPLCGLFLLSSPSHGWPTCLAHLSPTWVTWASVSPTPHGWSRAACVHTPPYSTAPAGPGAPVPPRSPLLFPIIPVPSLLLPASVQALTALSQRVVSLPSWSPRLPPTSRPRVSFPTPARVSLSSLYQTFIWLLPLQS